MAYKVPSKITFYPVGFFLVVPFLLALGFYLAFFAPCSWYSGTDARNVPARCVKEFLP